VQFQGGQVWNDPACGTSQQCREVYSSGIMQGGRGRIRRCTFCLLSCWIIDLDHHAEPYGILIFRLFCFQLLC